MTTEDRLQAPSTERNAEPVFEVISRILPASGTVLEIASGSGEHGAMYAPRLPHLNWQPSDRDEPSLRSIEAWRQHRNTDNLLPAMEIDLLVFDPAVASNLDGVTAMFNMNMIHISPWAVCEGLLTLAEHTLPAGAPLYLYGPYIRADRQTAPGNVEFDQFLRSRDAAWGVRKLEDVVAAAEAHSLELDDVIDMPSNNFSVIFRRR